MRNGDKICMDRERERMGGEIIYGGGPRDYSLQIANDGVGRRVGHEVFDENFENMINTIRIRD